MSVQLATNLDKFKLFDGLSDSQRERLWSMCERVEIRAGDTIVEQGETGEELFLIDQGEFAVVHRDGHDLRDRERTLRGDERRDPFAQRVHDTACGGR